LEEPEDFLGSGFFALGFDFPAAGLLAALAGLAFCELADSEASEPEPAPEGNIASISGSESSDPNASLVASNEGWSEIPSSSGGRVAGSVSGVGKVNMESG
jgi:hypothetical protein